MKTRYLLLALLPILLLAAIAGCDSASNPIAPSGSVLSISASPTRIALDGQSSAINISGFRPDGNPLNPQTQLTLSSTIGVLRAADSASAPVSNVIEVDESGRAEVFLFGDGRQGVATVTVSLTTGGEGATATVDVQIGDDATSQPVVTVDANPRDLSVGGTSQITVTAKAADGSPLTSGVVNVRSNLGTLGSTTLQLSSGNNGVVSTTLTSSQSGTATVTASAGSSAEATVEVTFGTTRKPSLIISANPSTIDVNAVVDGSLMVTEQGESRITVIARDESGNPLGGGQRITLTSDLGNVARSSSVGGTGQPAINSITTDSNGEARFFYYAQTRAGTGNVTAILGNSDPASVSITIRSAPAGLILVANPQTVSNTGGSIELIATVTDSDGDPLGGELVRFTLEDGINGTFDPDSGTATTDSANGQARVTVTFEDSGLPEAGSTFQVFASVGNLSASQTITVE